MVDSRPLLNAARQRENLPPAAERARQMDFPNGVPSVCLT